MASYCQKSTVLSRNRASTPPPPSHSTFPFLPSSLNLAHHISSCGHVMHATCWQKYFDDVLESERRRYRTRHPTSFDIEKSSFSVPCAGHSPTASSPSFHNTIFCISLESHNRGKHYRISLFGLYGFVWVLWLGLGYEF